MEDLLVLFDGGIKSCHLKKNIHFEAKITVPQYLGEPSLPT